MDVWLLYRTDRDWTGNEGDRFVGAFSSPQLAVNYARRERLHEHNAPSGPIVPDAPLQVPYIRLNDAYSIRRETLDPSAAGHVCSLGTCITPIA